MGREGISDFVSSSKAYWDKHFKKNIIKWWSAHKMVSAARQSVEAKADFLEEMLVNWQCQGYMLICQSDWILPLLFLSIYCVWVCRMQISSLFCFLCGSAVMKPVRNSQEETGPENRGLRERSTGVHTPETPAPRSPSLKIGEMFPTSSFVNSSHPELKGRGSKQISKSPDPSYAHL